MSWIEALILGLVQGLTEFLPVSSSGHLELGKALFGVDFETGMGFTVAVHGATVLSTLVVFRKQIASLVRGALKFRWNDETRYIVLILLSMVPVGLAGLFFKDQIESLFSGNIVLVGSMLLVTASLLFLTHFFTDKGREISFWRALLIGIAQAVAVIPGISRSGATIATGMILGISRSKVAEFSFLMVLLPVIGANVLEFSGFAGGPGSTTVFVVMIGFTAAFVAGLVACRVMIELVKSSRLWWFSVYCVVAGVAAILLG
ncbi:MAG: undecaprenyl-diphosphate phosphatase [Bacteroidales bacterium]|nr:undecaprenyl-diphosphate phosphatase [Bacteroidales bacterium]